MAQLEPKDRAVQMSQHLFSELAERKANDPMLQKVICVDLVILVRH